MPTASIVDWMTLLASLVGMGLFGGAAWWALYSDRGRSRRRCPQCWFNMKFTAGLRCTECGHASREEKDLYRTRRRPAIGFLALLGCAILGARGIDHLRVGGWGRYLPTPALVSMVGTGTLGFRQADAELLRRARAGSLDADTWQRILDGAADGSVGAPVGSPQWIGRHGPWAFRAWEALTVAGEGALARDAREVILDIATQYPPEIELETPTRWPAGRAIAVGVIVRETWNVPMPVRLVVTSDASRPRAFARYGPDIQTRSFTVDLPPMEAGRHPLTLDFAVSRSLTPGSPWVGDRTTSVQTVLNVVAPGREPEDRADLPPSDPPPPGLADGRSETGTPGSDPEMLAGVATGTDRSIAVDPSPRSSRDPADPGSVFDRLGADGSADVAVAIVPEPLDEPVIGAFVSRVFDGGAVQWADGSLPVRVTVRRSATATPLLNDIAIGIEVEVRRNGLLGRTLELWWIGGQTSTRPGAWEVPFVDDEVLLPPATPDDRWELIIRGREDLALRVAGARYWWSGEITRPLTVVRRGGMAPSRGWVPVPVPADDDRSENSESTARRDAAETLAGGPSDGPGMSEDEPSLGG